MLSSPLLSPPLLSLTSPGFVPHGEQFLAMPLAIMGNTFTSVWEERHLVKLRDLLHQLLTENEADIEGPVRTAARAFAALDTQSDGIIDSAEFERFVTDVLGLRLSHVEISELWRSIDLNATGAINVIELTARMFPTVDVSEVVAASKGVARAAVEDDLAAMRRSTCEHPPAGAPSANTALTTSPSSLAPERPGCGGAAPSSHVETTSPPDATTLLAQLAARVEAADAAQAAALAAHSAALEARLAHIERMLARAVSAAPGPSAPGAGVEASLAPCGGGSASTQAANGRNDSFYSEVQQVERAGRGRGGGGGLLASFKKSRPPHHRRRAKPRARTAATTGTPEGDTRTGTRVQGTPEGDQRSGTAEHERAHGTQAIGGVRSASGQSGTCEA